MAQKAVTQSLLLPVRSFVFATTFNSVLAHFLLFFTMLLSPAPFSFAISRPEVVFSGNVVLVFSEHMTDPSPFFLAISTAMSFCSTISLSSLLDTTFEHLILDKDRRHRFMNTLTFLVSSFRSFQYSDPRSNTNFKLPLKILSLVLVVI